MVPRFLDFGSPYLLEPAHRTHLMLIANIGHILCSFCSVFANSAFLQERFLHIRNASAKYATVDYLATALSSPHPQVQAWGNELLFIREANVNSLYGLVDSFGIEREVVSVAANIIDRCLSKWIPAIESSNGIISMPYQLEMYCYTALYLAIKTHLGKAPEQDGQVLIPPITTFLSHYPIEVINAAELHILFELQWNVYPTTPESIARDLLSLLPLHLGVKDAMCSNYMRDVHHESVRSAELATKSYECSTYCPITVALASVMSTIRCIYRFAMLQDDPLQLFKDAVHSHLGEVGISCDATEVLECMEKISSLRSLQYQEPVILRNVNSYIAPVTP